MGKCLRLIQNFDYLSNEVKLTIHQHNDSRSTTVIGGGISILSILILLALCLFFFIKLLKKGNVFVTVSSESTSFNNLTDTDTYPFLIRMTDKMNRPLKNPDQVYTIYLKYWYGGSNESNELVEQSNYNIEVEKCSIDKHFGKYKHLFENITDLHTFFCPKPRHFNETIYGRYGDLNPFGYYHFYLTMCIDKAKCLPLSEIKDITENAYLDFRTVNHDINNYYNKAKVETILSDRHMISSTVYKRIWFYFNEIKYMTDDGLFFAMNSIDTFAQYESMKYDTDLRDLFQGTYPGTFVTMTLLSTGRISIYNRRFLKLQDYLASVGGIIQFVQICAFMLNYVYSHNSYYSRLINDLNLLQESRYTLTNNSSKKSASVIMKGKLNQFTDGSKLDYSDKKTTGDLKFNQRNMAMISKMQKTCYKFCPIACYRKSETSMLRNCIERVKEMMNIASILAKLEDYRKYVNSNVTRDKTLTNLLSNKLINTNDFKSLNKNIKVPCSVNNFLEKSNQKLSHSD